MKIINNYSSCAVSYAGLQSESKLPKKVIEKYGLNMDLRVGAAGKSTYAPAPDTLVAHVKNYLRALKVDWNTHIDPTKVRRRFE